MRLSNIAILALRGHKDIKKMIAEELGVSVNRIYEYIRFNEDNNDLTKVAALAIIERETTLTKDQILEEAPMEKVA